MGQAGEEGGGEAPPQGMTDKRQLPMWSASGRAPSQTGEFRDPDADLDTMSQEDLLGTALPEVATSAPDVPPTEEFLERCAEYRRSLDRKSG